MNKITQSSLLPARRSNSLTVGKTYVGIDFGTTTTVVSIATYDAASDKIFTQALRMDQQLMDGSMYSAEIIPTVIAWLSKPERILVGEGASELKYKFKKGKNIWFSFKMELGEDLGAKYYESELRDIEPFKIRNPKDCARVFFMYLKYLIIRYCDAHNLSKDISFAISIPASFEANQRKDLLDALLANDINVSKQALIDEPNAAFISYVVTRATEGEPMHISPDYNSKVLVFDFGGGTCDISILEIGQNINGFFSKNIAISKFTKLGGDDIDRYITYHYLMPRFLEANGKTMSQFRTREKAQIATSLFKVAERLKIMLNKNLAMMTNDFQMPVLKNSDMKVEVESEVEVITNKGDLKQSKFYLTYKELTATMNVFIKTGLAKTTRIKGEEEYNSIFTPIESAIKKSRTPKEEIDYVLFIGGSSQSPYIQEALNKYFEDSELLVPMNLQTHVSQGAAIHSLLLHGMNKCVIQPITSEPILVITKDAQPKIILPAGTKIPCDTVAIEDLVSSRQGQQTIELPVCVGSTNKMLFNLKIKAPTNAGFPINSPIKLILEVNADKMLIAHATCMGVTCTVEPVNPFANKELTTEERIALKAERQANLESEQNNGVPSKETLEALRRAYEKAGNDFKAAETYELQSELYPSSVDFNSLGVLYHNAGETEKAIEYYERALQNNPNDQYANANLGHNLMRRDPKRAKKHLQKTIEINPEHDTALINLGHLLQSEGNSEEAKKNFQKVYDMYLKKWNTNSLPKYAYGWFADVAEELGQQDFARQIRQAKPKVEGEVYYEPDNLSRTKNNQLTK